MTDCNLIELLSKLSLEIVENGMPKKRYAEAKERKTILHKFVRKVRQRGLDVLMGKMSSDNYKPDPCLTDYGAYWDPSVLILDYGLELQREGADKSRVEFLHNVTELQKNNILELNQLFTLLLMLKGPGVKEEKQHPFSFSGDGFFLRSDLSPFEMLPSGFTKIAYETRDVVLWGGVQDERSFDLFHNTEPMKKSKSGLFEEQEVLLDCFVKSPIKHDLPQEMFKVKSNENLVCMESNQEVKAKSVWNKQELLKPQEMELDIELKHLTMGRHVSKFAEEYENKILKKVKTCPPELRKVVSVVFFENKKEVILGLWKEQAAVVQTLVPDMLPEFELNVIELPTLVYHIKFMMIGIPTSIFTFDEDKEVFCVVPGACLEGVTPETFMEFVEQFLDIGTCYVRLSKLGISNGQYETVSLIHQTLWKSVFAFLNRHYEAVLALPDSCNLLELRSRAQVMYHTMVGVARVCCVWCSTTSLPTQGGPLLSYLLAAAQRLGNKHLQKEILSLFTECVVVYMRWFIQTWMFTGQVPGCSGDDFFIHHRLDKAKNKDRTYYLSFEMMEELMPDFLSPLAERIFICGKAIHMLQLFNPDNKLGLYLEHSYPQMKLCMDDHELDVLVHDYERYRQQIEQCCGKSISVMSLKEEVKLRDEITEAEIYAKQKELAEERKLERERMMEERRKRKDEQIKKLLEQIEFAKNAKAQKKLIEDNFNKKMDDEINARQEKEKALIEQEKRTLEKYYKELMNSAETRIQRAKWQKERMALTDKRNDLLNSHEDKQSLTKMEGGLEKDLENANIDGAMAKDVENANFEENLTEKEECTNANAGIKRLEELTEAQLERLKNMRSQYEALAEKEENANYQIHVEQENIKNISAPGLTEAQKNKLKILGTEFGLQAETVSPLSQTQTILSKEAQKNKPNLLSTEFGTPEEKLPETTENSLTDAQRNKQKILGTEFGAPEKYTPENTAKFLTEAEKNKLKVLSVEFGAPKESLPETAKKPLTEAQKNKLKILNTEFGGSEDIAPETQGATLTDAQKNKLKILNTEFGALEEITPKTQIATLTDAQKNKLKILGSEFGSPEKSVSKTTENILTEAQKNKIKILHAEFGESEHQVPQSSSTSLSQAQKNKLKILGTCLKEENEATCGQVVQSESKNVVVLIEVDDDMSSLYTDLETRSNEQVSSVIADSSDMSFKTASNDTISTVAELETKSSVHQNIGCEFFCNVPKYEAPKSINLSAMSDFNFHDFKKKLVQSITVTLATQEKIANEAILKHFLIEEDLLSHLNSLRSYFFFNDGEFARSLTQNAFRSLSRCLEPRQFFERTNLNSIVNEALNYTIHNSDSNARNVSFKIINMPANLDHAAHDVLAPFELSYQVKWPVNILVTEKALGKYKQVFHFLLKLKRIIWTFNENFLYLTCLCKDSRLQGTVLLKSLQYHKVQIYRHAMAQFILTLEDYVYANGMETAWATFQKDLETAGDLDQLYQKHVRYVKDVLRRCFLTKQSHEIGDIIHRLIEFGLQFHFLVKGEMWVLEGDQYVHPRFKEMRRIFREFCAMTREFLKTLRKKMHVHSDLKIHSLLLEKLDIKLAREDL